MNSALRCLAPRRRQAIRKDCAPSRPRSIVAAVLIMAAALIGWAAILLTGLFFARLSFDFFH